MAGLVRPCFFLDTPKRFGLRPGFQTHARKRAPSIVRFCCGDEAACVDPRNAQASPKPSGRPSLWRDCCYSLRQCILVAEALCSWRRCRARLSRIGLIGSGQPIIDLSRLLAATARHPPARKSSSTRAAEEKIKPACGQLHGAGRYFERFWPQGAPACDRRLRKSSIATTMLAVTPRAICARRSGSRYSRAAAGIVV